MMKNVACVVLVCCLTQVCCFADALGAKPARSDKASNTSSADKKAAKSKDKKAKSGKKSRGQIRLKEVRSYSGIDNHPAGLGVVGQPLLRVSYSDYPGDGSGETIKSGVNPRLVSNIVVHQGSLSLPSQAGLTDMIWAWGQFIDHDIGLTDSHPINGTADIPVPPGDILIDRIFFNRANHVVVGGVREQINEISAFLDGSGIYGSDPIRALALREGSGGRLRTSPGRLLPLNTLGFPNLGTDPELFLAGDIRANENVVLTSMHTLFMREHNRLAGKISQLAPEASDEEIYQLARKIVGAELQIITYEEFLPALMGPWAPAGHSPKFDPDIDPRLANEFSAALFRVGHTMLSSELVLGDTGESILLRDAFTNPDFIKQDPRRLDLLLQGLSVKLSQQIDSMIIEDVRTFLFLPPPFAIGLDLAALNIQRGRDHGLPSYNEVRLAYGLPPVSDFEEITSDVVTQEALQAAYEDVDAIDPWVGAISEEHVYRANVGPLILCALDDQFSRLRDGDRFFYTRDKDLRQSIVNKVINLRQVTMGNIIRWNTAMVVPDDCFVLDPDFWAAQ